MKNKRIPGQARLPLSFLGVFGGLCFALALSGCVSVSSSPAPRFYMLEVSAEAQPIKMMPMAFDGIIGVGPVKIPEYLNRPQMVVRSKNQMLTFAQFDRWGQPLDQGIAHLIRENLVAMLPQTKLTLYPWDPAIAVQYQVVIEIVGLDSTLDGDLFLVAQWTVVDVKNTLTKIIQRSEFRQPVVPRDYSGLAKTLSKVCTLLAGEIAQALATLDVGRA